MKKFCLILIKIYQKFISKFFGKKCRFYPTCSQYALESVKKYGVFRGGFMAIKRIAKCHPFHKGGYDPVV